ncbi:MAG TPA: LamG-like jellyroll fold domain-containing protein [Kofleriaceae bacterium]|nr:LamG-like jellyroll fold domain-containing protein [Kofleriaceae bacterium]
MVLILSSGRTAGRTSGRTWIRPATRVLVARLGALSLMLAGCNESLFGAHRGGPGAGDAGPDGGDVPGVCVAPCVANAGAEYDGTPGGKGGHWRYLDDLRSPRRMWAPMTASGGEMTGAGGNRITTCALEPGAAACGQLPGALLISSAGATSDADPAIELAAPLTRQAIELELHAVLPAGDKQTIRLYRNSREDALVTATLAAGDKVDQTIELDAIPGDRFLVAVAPSGNGATDVGVQLVARVADKPFPLSCQFTLQLNGFVGNSTTDQLCSDRVYTHLDATMHPAAIALGAAPFAELGSSIQIPGGTYLHDFLPSDVLDYSQDVTVQLWANLRLFAASNPGWVFSDLGATGGGLGIAVTPSSATFTISTPTTSGTTSVVGVYPDPNSWHFIRVVRTSTSLRVCLDGVPAGSVDATPVMAAATMPPDLGKDLLAAPGAASIDGFLDDVRVLTGALTCE